MNRIAIRRALISVSDKTGIEDLGRGLVEAGATLVSSGGTARVLTAAGLPVTKVSEVTGHPEMLGGRVKTLHPRIHGGILADLGDPTHQADLQALGVEPFELVVVNLYPFTETVFRPGVTRAEAIEQIDIGGPAMMRAAAKNHGWVGVVTSPDQYPEVLEAVAAGGLDDDLRQRLARAAFFHTAGYDAAIVEWLEGDDPDAMVLPLRRAGRLRYGENPHQSAGLYRNLGSPSWWERARLLQGKEMSYNNFLDADAGWRHVQDHSEPVCVIVKHTNPCGVAVAGTVEDAFRRAWACDQLAAFGSVIALNRPLDLATAEAMIEAGFIEVVVAPGVEDEQVLAARPNLRVLVADVPAGDGRELRMLDGGFLLQERDRLGGDWKVVSGRSPTPAEETNLRFAWTVAAHTKSNAIVIARDGQAVGIGAGDQSRVGSVHRALTGAGERARGAVAASDGFFPFRDGIDALAAAGVTAVVEPGGSVRDGEVLAAAEEHGLAVVFTGRRHFLH